MATDQWFSVNNSSITAILGVTKMKDSAIQLILPPSIDPRKDRLGMAPDKTWATEAFLFLTMLKRFGHYCSLFKGVG